MSFLRPRSIVVLFAAMVQLVMANAVVFAGTLPLASEGHGHEHPTTLVAHEGHVDVVLHHEEEAPAAGESLGAERVHGDDHVLHVASGDASAKRSQEHQLDAAVLPRGIPLAATPAPIASSARTRALDARSLPCGLRSTVLRL